MLGHIRPFVFPLATSNLIHTARKPVSHVIRYKGRKEPHYIPGTPNSVIKLGFADSGVGGLVFMLHVLDHFKEKFDEYASKYHVNFALVHLGDAHNAPYGTKSRDEINRLTRNLLSHLVREEDCKINVIACNTASTTWDASSENWAKHSLGQSHVFPILNDSARELYDQALRPFVDRMMSPPKELHVGVLATQATTKSQQFPKLLSEIHSDRFPKGAYTVVLNSESHNKPQVFSGKIPVASGSGTERDILSSIQRNTHDVPVLYVHTHAPKNWVSVMEGKVPGDIDHEVRSEIQLFHKQSDGHFSKIKTVGLFCTHYPFLERQIDTALTSLGASKTHFVTQGPLITDRLIRPSIESLLGGSQYPKRIQPISLEDVRFSVKSITTGNPDLDVDIASYRTAMKVAKVIAPQLSDRVNFSLMNPIQSYRFFKSTEGK
ncbi:hypothetical protein EB093_08220 [bacterium]|nr:hypothetical protein [bacterium]